MLLVEQAYILRSVMLVQCNTLKTSPITKLNVTCKLYERTRCCQTHTIHLTHYNLRLACIIATFAMFGVNKLVIKSSESIYFNLVVDTSNR